MNKETRRQINEEIYDVAVLAPERGTATYRLRPLGPLFAARRFGLVYIL